MEKKRPERGKVNPAAKANPLSRVSFTYMLPILIKNYLNGLTEEDMTEPLDEHRSQPLGDKLEKYWWKEYQKHKKAALHIALIKMFGPQVLLFGFLKLIDAIIIVVVTPLAIGRLVLHFQRGEDSVTQKEAYLSATVMLLSLAFDSMVSHPCMMGMMHVAMKMRVSCSALIYRKALRLNKSALGQTTAGQMVNLLSNDVSKFDQGFAVSHFVWIAPIQTIVGTYMLYRFIGVAAIFGILFVASFIPLQALLGKRTSVLRLRIALRTDERVRLMNEIISGIQVIKMYTWEKPFAKIIALARRKEVKAIRQQMYLLSCIFSFETFATRTSIFISVLTFVLSGNNLTAEIVFSVTAIYNALNPIITILFAKGITAVAEANASIKRLHNYMSLEEVEKKEEILNGFSDENKKLKGDPRVVLKGVSAKWVENATENTLKGINLSVESSQLIAVIGPVGSGKSSLFHVILNELRAEEGSVVVDGVVSYASQEPWLFNDSVRRNILFGSPFEEERYRKVVKVCALESDFALLPFGDRTIVSEKGKSLSGGQKARINLARCVYKKADIYLLDDPLSAVDANVGKQLYENCIKDFLKSKICILNTHQLQYLKNADKIVIMKEGAIQIEGKYEELHSSGFDFAKLLEEFAADGDNEGEAKGLIDSKKPTEEENSDEDGPEIEKEVLVKGGIKLSIYKKYFQSGGNCCLIFLLVFTFLSSQGANSIGDYIVTYWVNFEQDVTSQISNNNTEPYIENKRMTILYTYTAMIVATIILALAHSVYFFVFCLMSSTYMHDFVFSKIIKATMRFFNTNPSGRILNRFSKDLGTIDEYIPTVMFDMLDVGMFLAGALILTCVVNPWLILPCTVFLILFYFFRVVYMETGRSVKRIEGIKRSPIYTQMMSTINGLVTIRAQKAESLLIKEFDENQDEHSSSWFLFISSSRALGYWLDMLCIFFITGITMGLLAFNSGLHGGSMGLILTQCMRLLGALQWGVRQWSELESQMTSVERLLEYSEVEGEEVREMVGKPPPKNWPEFGRIEFREIYLKYNPNEGYVLKNLNFVIEPKEKIGIVGRTGAGKSSIISVLFQLYKIEGNIFIDDVDCNKLPLEQIRSKISIIPQEPVLFSGTMRKNLDPFDEYPDELLWNALEQVEMKEVVAEVAGGLNMRVSEGGANYSVGQRQLICLARAIIRNNKILVMDEATANVDPYTDGLIQSTIRKKFKDCTVLTIAHRLHTVMDSDRILVMDAGCVEEFDHPGVLLQNERGFLYKLVQKTGQSTSKNLINVAKVRYALKKSQ